ncbi:MAG: hypothetical protein N3F07_03615 [Candidatus Micrarchaeota archaeon]|nr:hypothetical protein [Candidatus Micrarchaeota archaeon]
MDEKIVKIVASKLKKYEGAPIRQAELAEIREAVFKSTGTNKSASFANVKKWVKAARSLLKKEGKEKESKAKPEKEEPAAKREPAIPDVPKKVEESVNLIKEEAFPQPAQEVPLPKPTIVFDKVYLQSIKFEIAGIRQTMERVSRQLDRLEKELSEHKSEE